MIREHCHELFIGNDSCNFFLHGICKIIYDFLSCKKTKASNSILQRGYEKVCDRNNIQMLQDYFRHKFSHRGILFTKISEAAICRCSLKYVFLKILQYSQENTRVGVFFLFNKVSGLQSCSFSKKQL